MKLLLSTFLLLISCTFISASAQSFSSSNLPIFIFDTHGKEVEDEPKINASLKVLYNTNGLLNHIDSTDYHYDGFCGIEHRGSYSQNFPKKNYGFETREDTVNKENDNFALLGLPKENDWILTANYTDRTYLKNALMYQLFRKTGDWASRTRHVEVVVNGEYIGLYVLTEKIKQDKNRIDIKEMDSDDTALPKLSGGYLIVNNNYDLVPEATGWASYNGPDYKRFEIKEPDNVEPEQKEFIEDFFKIQIEGTLNQTNYATNTPNWRELIDEKSFMKSIIFQEFSGNEDAYNRSQYFIKDRNEPVKYGPVWDYNFAFGRKFFGYRPPENWILGRHSSNSPLFWFTKMLDDCAFNNDLIDEYHHYRENIFDETIINNYIDSVALDITAAAARDLIKWPETHWEHLPPQDLNTEISDLKSWIGAKLAWMDLHLHDIGDNAPRLSSSVSSSLPNTNVDFTVSGCSGSNFTWHLENPKDTTIFTSNSRHANIPVSVDSYVYGKCVTPSGCELRSEKILIEIMNSCPEELDLDSQFDMIPQYQLYRGEEVSINQVSTDLSLIIKSEKNINILPGFISDPSIQGFTSLEIEDCPE